MKFCPTCELLLSDERFDRDARSYDELKNICKRCSKGFVKEIMVKPKVFREEKKCLSLHQVALRIAVGSGPRSFKPAWAIK